MTLGGVFHDLLEAFHDPERREPQTFRRLLELAGERWRDEETPPRALAVHNRQLLERMLRDYHAHEVAAGRVGEVLAVEKRFEFSLDASTLSGYIDRIERRADGCLCLLDYKTGKWPMPEDEAEQDLQLALYALACRAVPELAELGPVAELVYLYPRKLTSGGARRSHPVTPDLTDRTHDRVRASIAGAAAERFDFSPEADCKWCEFKPVVVEQPFTLYVGEGLSVEGRIDAIFEREDGGWEVVDYKTGTSDPDPLQLATYATAVEEIWNRPVSASWLLLRTGAERKYDASETSAGLIADAARRLGAFA
jgi:RecB family exonuclease